MIFQIFDNDARTPLHYAALQGKLNVVKRLLKGKARNATRDCYGVSPAHYAAQRGYIDVVDCILKSAGGVVSIIRIAFLISYIFPQLCLNLRLYYIVPKNYII